MFDERYRASCDAAIESCRSFSRYPKEFQFMNKSQEFWNKQVSSFNRRDDDVYYKAKAAEHAAFMLDEHKILDCIDLGCGAGEILDYLSDFVRVRVGLDFSNSMLEAARLRLHDKEVELISADIFEYLPESKCGVWMTCCGINQYLNAEMQRRFLDLFNNNIDAKALYLFDCVDHMRYSLLPFGISYLAPIATMDSKKNWPLVVSLRLKFLRCIRGIAMALGGYSVNCKKLGGAKMGYGYLPKFWLDECRNRGFEIDIVSSRFFEYRYHVLIKKV